MHVVVLMDEEADDVYVNACMYARLLLLSSGVCRYMYICFGKTYGTDVLQMS
jgi:hypothetical protein